MSLLMSFKLTAGLIAVQDSTTCRLKASEVHVQIVPQQLTRKDYCPDLHRIHTLKAGNIVKVFDPKPMVLTVRSHTIDAVTWASADQL